MFDNKNFVSFGFWYYSENIKTSVAIEKKSTKHGTGDCEDDQDMQNDKVLDNYYIWFSSAGTKDFKNGAGYKLDLDEAKAEAERIVGQKINWTNISL